MNIDFWQVFWMLWGMYDDITNDTIILFVHSFKSFWYATTIMISKTIFSSGSTIYLFIYFYAGISKGAN